MKKSIRRRVQVGAVTKRQAMGEARVLTPDGSVPGPLPWAEEEAEQVAALYGTRAHVGVRPTEAWVRQWLREHGGRARVIHLATHGYLMPYRAMSSGVLLAVPEKTPEEGEVTANDGALQAWESATEWRLRADRGVRAACETGRGAEGPGEGLVGLTRALQIAGARSVVASQWQVADDSTQELMVAFHRQRKAGVGKDKALMLAMRQVAARSGWSHPHFWSPFVLVGDWR